MLRLRRSNDRGTTHTGWLLSRHTFSFGGYLDPRHMGFQSLRVINEDRVAPGAGFGEHPHREMEILSFVLEGAMEHRDSMGNGSVIRAGEVQRMTAGTGVRHSEFNHSRDEELHFLQVWIEPGEAGLEPGYEQASPSDREGFVLLASSDGRDGSLRVHQDVSVLRARLGRDEELTYPVGSGRHAWVQVLDGVVEVNGQRLEPGDGAALSDLETVILRGAAGDNALLLFDLA